MADRNRVTQLGVETISQGKLARVTQLGVEIITVLPAPALTAGIGNVVIVTS